MEDMIKRRVKEGNFSDVLPPAPQKDADAGPSGTLRRAGDAAGLLSDISSPPACFADEQELSQEKNKLGLGEVRMSNKAFPLLMLTPLPLLSCSVGVR